LIHSIQFYFYTAVKNDILEALKYAKNEIELKEILLKFGYKDLGFRNQNIQGKRKKTGLKFSYENKRYMVYFNQIGLDESTILFHLQNNAKSNTTNTLDSNQKSNIQKRVLEIPCQSDKIISRIEHGREI
jgi:hypothetical protein